MNTLLTALCIGTLLVLTLILVYQWALALVAVCPHRENAVPARRRPRFHVIIPAHDEELGLSATLESLTRLWYPGELLGVTVVADRCCDGTAGVARDHGVQCFERQSGPPGKGAAIAWGIEELRRLGVAFDALVVLDADTTADPRLLEAFAEGLAAGHAVQQGYNYLSNPWETPFTRLIAVTSVLRNRLFYSGKSGVGLAGMLTGTGMCFDHATIARHGWTAFSVGEDWELSASLLLQSVKIHFNSGARVFARESEGLRQASTQRLRWASGRYAVASAAAWKLCVAGLRRGRPHLIDAAFTLLIPTYSVQATLAALCLAVAWLVSNSPTSAPLFAWAALVVTLLGAYFILGVLYTDAPGKTLQGMAFIPIFLPWRITIEVLGLLGYGRKRWVRTARLSSESHKVGH
jgi:cellulose synthase/poly-beta-1,6-N-acetylglucosamine synthase-like glycosyltransferase